ncbi:hypothetical protein SEA_CHISANAKITSUNE_77 [Gordonia phage ChisanaKitsune]|uniref:Uncharacterized protein n=1 Tax=Gordonia phage ChisanaKitsune TaxID=2871538 RepID=A0AAE7XF46_9CAUD|nr:hypothetical protein PQD15_gp077 [Gordonia phage ChisanaKitsune]QZE10843.1 hypothetical protein SEA_CHISANAKITSUNE_77 [Gordonia phage ChisanaKitsune]
MTTIAPEYILINGVIDGSYDDVIDELYRAVQVRRQKLGKAPMVRKRGSAPGGDTEPKRGSGRFTPPATPYEERMKHLGAKTAVEYQALSDRLKGVYLPIDNGRYYVSRHRRGALVGETIKLGSDVAGQRFHYLKLRCVKANTKTIECEVITGTHADRRNRYRGVNPILPGQHIRIPYQVAAKAYITGEN